MTALPADSDGLSQYMHQTTWADNRYSNHPTAQDAASAVNSGISPGSGLLLDPALANPEGAGKDAATNSGDIAFSELQNTSDALDILAQIASTSTGEAPPLYRPRHLTTSPYDGSVQIEYPLIQNGSLSQARIAQLLTLYQAHYHDFYPIVPAASLDPRNLAETAREEPHLLTAMLVMASRDLIEEPAVFKHCADHMRSLVSSLAAGGACSVEAVEALLLLAEWTPYTSRSDAGNVGRGEEDREAWMHVGTALRIAYFLGLDRYAFPVRNGERDPLWQRKRLVWTACYMSDRQISIRLGRAFWSRGPGPLTTLRREDFPMLAPRRPDGEDHASIFQAQLELTMLFSNVHDVLYSNPGNVSMRNHLSSSSYVKYIDDFRTAIYGWKAVWDTLTCAPHLKATLRMSYDYLRLYTNAFAFHTTVKRALPGAAAAANPPPTGAATSAAAAAGPTHESTSGADRLVASTFRNIGAIGDARFIYEGLDAAKSLLSMVTSFVDPERALRFMPLRFYLYSIYSGVFLYRARCVGVLAPDEEQSVRAMIAGTVNRLERSAVGAQHPGRRYARLLKLLWDRVDRTGGPGTEGQQLESPYRPGAVPDTLHATAASGGRLGGPAAKEPSATAEIMGDFSWTDLDAIGDFAVNGTGRGAAMDSDFWAGFLPAESGNFLFDDALGADWNMAM